MEKRYSIITYRASAGFVADDNRTADKVIACASHPAGYTGERWREYVTNFDAYAKPGDMLVLADRVIVRMPELEASHAGQLAVDEERERLVYAAMEVDDLSRPDAECRVDAFLAKRRGKAAP
jgi:hypothetical protein